MSGEADPTAQGPQTGAELPGVEAAQGNEQKETPGVQKRIDELVAQFHDERRTNQQLMATNQELLAAVARSHATAAAQTPEPLVPEGFDYSNPAHLAQVIERATKQATAPLMQHIEQLAGQVNQTQVQGQMGVVEAKLQKLQNPVVANRVQALLKSWENHPVYKTAKPMDAYNLALGEYADGQLGPVHQSRNERGQFNSGGQPLLSGHSGGRQPVQRGAIESSFNNVDLNSLSYDQLSKLVGEVEKNNPDGVPLIG